MKVISETRPVHYTSNLHFYNQRRVNTSAGGLLVPDVIIRPAISPSALKEVIAYIFD